MSASRPSRGAATQPNPPVAEENQWYDTLLQLAKQAFIVWVFMQLVPSLLKTPTPKSADHATSEFTTTPQRTDSRELPPVEVLLGWKLGQPLSIHVYLSATPVRDSAPWTGRTEHLPSIVWENITFGNWSDLREVFWEVKVPESTKRNGSLWADVFLVKDGASLNPHHKGYNPDSVHYIRKLLTPYLVKAKVRKEKNLLSATGDVEEEVEPDVIVPHWSGNLTLGLVSDSATFPYAQLPPMLLEHIHPIPDVRDSSGSRGQYKPIIFPNEFWHLRSQYQPVNHSTAVLPLRVQFQPMSALKFQFFATMTHGFKEAAEKQGGASMAELDEIKRMLVETNPWFLAVTALVSVLHVVFEMLAFKSDVSHWREKRELVGVSVRSQRHRLNYGLIQIVANVFVQLVILLYLIDNNTDTSWMILLGSGVGVLIEAWKITKAVDISVIPAPPGSIIPYKVDVKDKHILSEDEKKTQEYDKLAFRYVSYVTIPTLAAYSVYSLVYENHRGWYSFVISTLTSFVYMFGFAQLIPQLIINYKLKSVAHMPMKAMIYKTLSTVVDDFFAFCIKMPFLHRLACFRDDVVFLIFLYQRWIYRVDPKRVNEYGQVLAGDVAKAEEAKAKKTQ